VEIMEDPLCKRNRSFLDRFALICCLMMLLSACGTPPRRGEPMEKFSTVRAALDKEWRDAVEIPAGEVRIDLGRIPRGGIVRLGVLAVPQDEAVVEVWAGRRKFGEIKTGNAERWQDARLELARHAWLGGGDCTLVCRSAKGMRLGPCELIAPEGGARNVLIVLLDTVRWDHLGCYGYPENTSPAIDRLAADGVRFHRLMPQSSWTRPSVASLLTSTYPPVHGAEGRYDPVRAGLPDLAEALNRQGYASLGLTTNPNCLPVWGLGNRFTRYTSITGENKQSADAAAIDAAVEGIAALAGRPWFVYLHLMAAHRPYTAPTGYADRFRPDRYVGTRPQRRVQADLVSYDGEIAWADEQVGRLMDALKESGCYENTLILLLSDHGEQFLEHGRQGHGVSLYEEELRVPFIVKLPGGAWPGESRQALVEMVDVAPTILDLLALEPEPRFQGRSFSGIVHQDRWEDRAGFASLRLDGEAQRTVKSRLAKYMVNDVESQAYWFDLDKDAEEVRPWRMPVPGALHYDLVATRMWVEGTPGLHVLVQPGPASEGFLRITVDMDGIDGFTFDCPAPCGRAAATPGGVEATVDLAKLGELPGGLTRVRAGWRPYAHLLIRTVSGGTAAIRAERNGEPIAGERVFMGPDARHAALEGSPLNLSDLACQPLEAPVPADEGLAVCVWTVASTDPIAPGALSEDTAKALNALGYLN
jgi:arylsulfatase A-like enzyme